MNLTLQGRHTFKFYDKCPSSQRIIFYIFLLFIVRSQKLLDPSYPRYEDETKTLAVLFWLDKEEEQLDAGGGGGEAEVGCSSSSFQTAGGKVKQQQQQAGQLTA